MYAFLTLFVTYIFVWKTHSNLEMFYFWNTNPSLSCLIFSTHILKMLSSLLPDNAQFFKPFGKRDTKRTKFLSDLKPKKTKNIPTNNMNGSGIECRQLSCLCLRNNKTSLKLEWYGSLQQHVFDTKCPRHTKSNSKLGLCKLQATIFETQKRSYFMLITALILYSEKEMSFDSQLTRAFSVKRCQAS